MANPTLDAEDIPAQAQALSTAAQPQPEAQTQPDRGTGPGSLYTREATWSPAELIGNALLHMIPLIGPAIAGAQIGRAKQAFTQQTREHNAMADAMLKAANEGNTALLSHPSSQKFGKAWFKDQWPGLMASAEFAAQQQQQVMGGQMPGAPPEAALAQGATGQTAPAQAPAGRPMTPPAGEPVFTPRQPPAGTAQPAAAGPKPTTSVKDQLIAVGSRQQGELPQGTSATIRLSDKVSVTRAAQTPDQLAQRVIATATRLGAPLSDVFDALNANGLPFPERSLETYANTQALRTYQAKRQEIAESQGLMGQQLDRAAARAAFDETGYIHPKLDKLTFADDVEARHEAVGWVQEQLKAGQPFSRVIQEAQTRRIPLNPEDIGVLRTQVWGDSFAKNLGAVGSAETAAQLATIDSGGAPNPAMLSLAFPQIQLPADVAAQVYQAGTTPGQKYGRVSPEVQKRAAGAAGAAAQPPAQPSGAAVGGNPIVAARKEEAAKAGEVKAAQEDVKIRPAEAEQEKTEKLITSYALATRINKAFQATPDMAGLANRTWARVPFTQIALNMNRLKEQFGALDDKQVKFLSMLGDLYNQSAFALGGVRIEATTNPAAIERVTGPLPKPGQLPNIFNARMQNLIQKLETEYRTRSAAHESYGLRPPPALTSGLAAEEGGGQPAGAATHRYNKATGKVEPIQ